MKRFALVLLALALLPVEAPAQNTISIDGQGNAARTHGITVSGTSSVKVPATQATVTVMVMGSPEPNGQPKTLQKVRDALTAAGIDAASISGAGALPMPVGSNVSTLSVNVKNPTLDTMKHVASAIASVSAGDGQQMFSMIQLRANNCDAATTAARTAAISKARANAAAVAKEVGVQLGRLAGVTVNNDQNSLVARITGGTDTSCSSQYSLGSQSFFGGMMGNADSEPDDYASVQVVSTVTITYEIK